MTAANDLKEALGLPDTLKLGDVDVRVHSIRLADLPGVIEAFTQPVQDAFGQVLDLGDFLQKSGLLKEGERIRLDGAGAMSLVTRLVPMMSTLPSAVRALQRLCTVCTDMKADAIGKLELDQATLLIARVIEVNADFFSRKLWPALASSWSRTTGRSSSRPATPSAPAGTGPASSSG